MHPVNRHPFEAVLVQYAQDPSSGERLNIGLVMRCSEAGYLEGKALHHLTRVTRAFPDAEPVVIRRTLSAITTACEATQGQQKFLLDPNLHALVGRILPPMDSGVVLCTEVITGITAAPEETHKRLFASLVPNDHEHPDDLKTRTDEDVWRDFSALLRGHAVRLMERNVKGLLDWTFKHVWRNGALNAIEPVSLDLKGSENIKEKAAAKAGIYRTVAPALRGEDLHLTIVVGEPAHGDERRKAARDGIKILTQQLEDVDDVEVVPEHEAGTLAKRIVTEADTHED